MTGRAILAEAHKRMTPEQIAAHALELCDVIEEQDELNSTLCENFEIAIRAYDRVLAQQIELKVLIRRAHSLINGHHKRAGRELLAGLAEIDVIRWEKPDFSALNFRRADASVFNGAE